MNALTHARLLKVLHYEPATGAFTWRVDHKTGPRRLGCVAGTVHINGYRQIQIDGVIHKEHRLAWFYIYGEAPALGIDHLDGCRSNNRIGNLRLADHTLNGQNRRTAQRNNKSGFLGVSPFLGRYQATIKTAGGRKHIGTFNTPEEAHVAYVATKRELHEGCTI